MARTLTVRRLIAAVTIAVLLPGCGRLDGGGATGGRTGSTSRIEHPTGHDDLVLRVGFSYERALVAWPSVLAALPSWSLFGDGTVIVQGPQIEIYPQPALPSLVSFHVDEDGVQTILEAARDAGLLDGDAGYGNDCVADAATTVFTTNAEGRTSVVQAYALEEQPGGGCEEDVRARRALRNFQASLGDLGSWLPDGSIGPERPYEPTDIRVFIQRYRSDPELPQPAIAWPLEPGLDTFGDPVPDALEPIRCGAVSGDDLETLLPLAAQANQLTPWTSEGHQHALLFRPLLPDEQGC